jgi:uncharacterized protein
MEKPAGSNTQDWIAELRSYIGRRYGVIHAWDAVNAPMIRQWCEAMDFDFAQFDPENAKGTVHGGPVAPASMLPVWLMPGLKNQRPAGSDPANPREVMGVLERQGYLGILGTNCEQEYDRYLRPGDRISTTHMVEAISEEKQTKFGPGFFITFLQEFFDQNNAPVGRMRLRILRFKPQPKAAVKPARPAPPQPALSQDTAFFWEGLKAGKLLIQRCTSCNTLRHPPGPACMNCHSLEWGTVQASGRGKLFSFVVMHHPQHPAFDTPHPVGLIELEEGTRLVAPLSGVNPDALEIGMAVEVVIENVEGEHRLPSFRPVRKG